MINVNTYHQELTAAEIAKGKHRNAVGGNWEEVGLMQLERLKSRGLRPEHTLCDVGCGALRGGVHFARYLDAGNYCGLDINASLIEGGRLELEKAGLADKKARLLVSDGFEVGQFGMTFDYMVAMSLFTHLFANHIVRCLIEARKVVAPDGQFVATILLAPNSGHLAPIEHTPGGVVSYYDRDPFHYSVEEMSFLAGVAGWKIEMLPVRAKPGNQRGLVFLPS